MQHIFLLLLLLLLLLFIKVAFKRTLLKYISIMFKYISIVTSMEKGKAAGPNKITVEMIESLDEFGIDMLKRIS